MAEGMFQFSSAIAGVVKGVSDQGNAAIGAVCAEVWSNVFPWVAGLVIGFTIIGMLFSDDLADGVRNFLTSLIPLLIVAWLIKPASGGCKVVNIKKDIMAMSNRLAASVGGSFGGDAGKVAEEVAKSLAGSLSGLEASLMEAMATDPPGQKTPSAGAGAVAPGQESSGTEALGAGG